MNDRDKLIERIRKLLSRTPGNGASQAEAETALSLARKLMDQYDLDMAQVEAHQVEGEEWTTETVRDDTGRKTPTDIRFIGPILCGFFRVRVFVMAENGVNRIRTQFFGQPRHVEIARWAYAYLSGIFQDLWIEHRVKTRARKDRQAAFYLGLSHGLYERLKAEREQEVGPDVPASQNALVLASDRLEEAFKRAHGDMPSRRRSTYRDGSTIQAGVAAGRDINLAQPVTGDRTRALPGPKGGAA